MGGITFCYVNTRYPTGILNAAFGSGSSAKKRGKGMVTLIHGHLSIATVLKVSRIKRILLSRHMFHSKRALFTRDSIHSVQFTAQD